MDSLKKQCSRCGANKFKTDFPKKGARCKSCVSVIGREWREKNKITILEKKKRYRDAMTLEQKQRQRISEKKWVAKNKDRNREHKKRWERENKQKSSESSRRWTIKNIEKVNERRRVSYHRKPPSSPVSRSYFRTLVRLQLGYEASSDDSIVDLKEAIVLSKRLVKESKE